MRVRPSPLACRRQTRLPLVYLRSSAYDNQSRSKADSKSDPSRAACSKRCIKVFLLSPSTDPFSPHTPGIPDSFASHPAVRAFHQDAWWVFAVLSAVHLVLYFRRRADRRREGMTGERPAVGALSISQARLLPVAGLLIWVMGAAILAPA